MLTTRHQAFQAAQASSPSRHNGGASARTCTTCATSSGTNSQPPSTTFQQLSRRDVMLQYALGAVLGVASISPRPAAAADKILCDEACIAALDKAEVVTTASGLKYKEIIVGSGPSPPVGYQVVVNYIAMTPEGRVFDSSLDRGAPYDIRIGAGSVIPGLDEGLQTMKVGGVRRLYIPGELAFPKGLPSAAGRPRVPPSSPVMFDVQLLYIPGLDD